jgi:hypothetical protein
MRKLLDRLAAVDPKWTSLSVNGSTAIQAHGGRSKKR